MTTQQLEHPFDTIGLFTFLRTYARRHDMNDPKSTIESWDECIHRVVDACNNQLNVNFSDDEKKELFELLFNLKCSVAGRFMWQLGSGTIDRLGLPSLQNCAAVIINEPIEPFTWAMNMLMLGCGIGVRILPEDVYSLPEVKSAKISRLDTKDADFIVPDSREGWVALIAKTLKAFFYSGKDFTYSCILLRSKGAPIKTFGGISSGPEVLCNSIELISNVLSKRVGTKIKPVDALDIINIIGQLVVSGNVRRSAIICLGDCKDIEYLRAKRWDLGNIPNYRAFSNNSVVCNNIEEILENDEFWHGYNGNGEPYGLINLDLMRKCGRIGDFRYPDPDVVCVNPCVSGDTWTMTSEGPRQVKDLVGLGKQTVVVNGRTYETTESGFFHTGNKMLFKLKTIEGFELDVTDNHLIKTVNNEWVEVKNLKEGHQIVLNNHSDINQWKGSGTRDEGYSLCNTKQLTNEIELSSFEFYSGFLSGLFDTNGFVVNNSIYLSNTDYSFMQCVQRMLLRMGIYSVIFADKNELHISGNALTVFNKYIGFTNINKQEKLNEILLECKSSEYNTYATVSEIVKLDSADVFDCTVPEISAFDANGLYVHNCSEQSLNNKETCCLAELYLPNINTQEELYKCASYLYKICKHSLMLPFKNNKQTENIVHKNMRIGLGITGYLQATKEQRSWLPQCYEMLRQLDKEYSKQNNMPESIKLTTVKPSGTLSLLGGVTSGVHPGFSRYYKRRIRIASESQLITIAKNHGYHVEYVQNFDGTNDYTTQIVTFPVKLPDHTILAEDCTAIDQLEYAKELQTNWSDNAVSITCYYRKHEIPEIKDWLRKNYNNSVKAVSFLLHNDHGFIQAPLEAITKEEYDEMIKSCRKITDLSGICYNEKDNDVLENTQDCAGGACPKR